MIKKIVIALVLILCFGVIAHAAPLPLVPGVTNETTKQTDKTTSKPQEEKTTQKKTDNTTTKTPTTEKQTEKSVVSGGDTSAINALTSRAISWFDESAKDESAIDKIAFSIEQITGDYRLKVIKAKELAATHPKSMGQSSMDSFRAAVDALMGFDYTYKG